jgi:hypothetical protein
MMVYTASETGGAQPSDEKVSVPGLLVAVAWVIGVAVGLIAVAIGHQVVAVVALALAVTAPGFGLAWIANSRSAAAEAPSDEPAPLPAGWHGPHFWPR